MLDKSDETVNTVNSDVLADDELLKYGADLDELEELKSLDKQFQKTASDLDKAQDQLKTIEYEIKKSREEEISRKKSIDMIFRKAREKEKNGSLEEALDIFLEILEYDKDNARANHHIERIKIILEERQEEEKKKAEEKKRKTGKIQELLKSGRKYYIDSQYEKALEAFNEALLISGVNAEISEFIDKTEKRIQEIEEAMNNARRESEERAKKVQELIIKARAKTRLEEYLPAIAILEEALIIMPDNKEVQELIRQFEKKFLERQEAEKRFSEEKKVKEKEYLSALLEAEDLMLKKHFVRAIEQIDQMIIDYPDKSDELTKLSFQAKDQLFISENEEKEQLKSKEKSLEEKEMFLKDNYGKGLGFYTIKDYEKAAHYFSLVMTQDPHYEDVENLMQRIEENLDFILKKKEEDKKESKKLELETSKVEIEKITLKETKLKERFQAALRYIREEKYEEAVRILEECYTDAPENEVYLRELEFARKELKKTREQQALQEITIKEKEEQQKKQNNLLKLYCEKAEKFFEGGFLEEARKEWEKSLTIDPSYQRGRDGLFKYHEEYKRIKDQEKQRALENKLKQEKIAKMNFDARLAFEKRDLERAVEVWQAVLSIDPYNEDAKNGALEAGAVKTLVSQYNDSKAMIERKILREERRLKELREDLSDAEKLFLEGDYKKACSVLNDLIQFITPGTDGL